MIAPGFGILGAMRSLRSLALGVAVTMLAACHRGPQAQSVARATRSAEQANARRRAAANDTAGLVEAPRIGKGTLALKLKFAPETRPVAGAPVAIDLALIPTNSANTGTLTIVDDPAFSVAAAERSRALPALDGRVAYRTRVVVIPTAPGVQTLDLDLTLSDALGSTQGRYALPLIVGAAAAGAPASTAGR